MADGSRLHIVLSYVDEDFTGPDLHQYARGTSPFGETELKDLGTGLLVAVVLPREFLY